MDPGGNVNSLKCPCKGCDRRKLLCHGSCQTYQQWKKELDAVNDAKRRDSEKYGAISTNRKHYVWKMIRNGEE